MKIVPLISSGTAGPLGVLHLPRLWLKVSLEARGALADGYPGAGQGYDQMVIDALGLDRDAVIAYITAERPTYPQFEGWIKAQPGAKLDAASICRDQFGDHRLPPRRRDPPGDPCRRRPAGRRERGEGCDQPEQSRRLA